MTMRRGDLITIADRGADYAGKPRPAVVIQSNLFDTLDSVTICPLTSTASDAPALRLQIEPSKMSLLDRTSWIAIDKITTVRRNRVGATLGHLEQPDLQRLNGALAIFLSLG